MIRISLIVGLLQLTKGVSALLEALTIPLLVMACHKFWQINEHTSVRAIQIVEVMRIM